MTRLIYKEDGTYCTILDIESSCFSTNGSTFVPLFSSFVSAVCTYQTSTRGLCRVQEDAGHRVSKTRLSKTSSG